MDTLPKRLRGWAHPLQYLDDTLELDLKEAAEEIEALTADNERLRKALEMAGKRLYKEGAPHSYVDDVQAVLDGQEVEYYDE